MLDLSGNQLGGSIPASFGNMTALTLLHLTENSLTGSIPSSIGAMTALVDVDISSTSVDGVIPTTLTQLTALTFLSLGNCGNLGGTIPTGIGALRRLQYATVVGLTMQRLLPCCRWCRSLPLCAPNSQSVV